MAIIATAAKAAPPAETGRCCAGFPMIRSSIQEAWPERRQPAGHPAGLTPAYVPLAGNGSYISSYISGADPGDRRLPDTVMPGANLGRQVRGACH